MFSLSGDILGCDIDLVYGEMLHNVNVNVDLCFRISCKLVGWLAILGFPVNFLGEWLLPNLKRWDFSTAQVLAEGKSGSWGGAQNKGDVHEFKLNKKIVFHSDLLQLCLKKK